MKTLRLLLKILKAVVGCVITTLACWLVGTIIMGTFDVRQWSVYAQGIFAVLAIVLIVIVFDEQFSFIPPDEKND